MLKFYADDSGSDSRKSGIFVLAGYIMEELRWEDFAELWDAQLKRADFFPIDYCRMADAESGDGIFSGIDRVFRKRKVADLAQVVKGCDVPAGIAAKMDWKDYNDIVAGNVFDKRLENPYAFLFFQVLRGVSELQMLFESKIPEQVKRDNNISIKPVEFIFDDQSEPGLKCLDWYAGLKPKLPEPHKTVLSNTPQFKDDRELTPLQAADMLAWHIRREYDYPQEDRSEIKNLLLHNGLLHKTISREELGKIVEVFNSGRIDPASI